jgi:3',5'-nucleoside bisphosphate phosphatase
MHRCVDLHTHSIYSDGSNTPQELVQLAVANGLTGLALTDHDTVEGVNELKCHGEVAGITVLSGVEISTTLRQHTLHILGYGIDPDSERLRQWLQPLQQGREKRNAAIIEKLHGLGVEISAEEMLRLSPCGQTGRPHIAKLLVEKGVVDSFDMAFRRYLGRNKAAWQGRFSYSAAETIRMIHETGGIAVLAHPGQIDPEGREQRLLIKELTRYDLDGLELFYPTHSRRMIKKLRSLAAEYNLITTGGSDFHGSTRSATLLASRSHGFCPPSAIVDAVLERLHRRTGTIPLPSPHLADHAHHTHCR